VLPRFGSAVSSMSLNWLELIPVLRRPHQRDDGVHMLGKCRIADVIG
jgi:hypothetical protein